MSAYSNKQNLDEQKVKACSLDILLLEMIVFHAIHVRQFAIQVLRNSQILVRARRGELLAKGESL